MLTKILLTLSLITGISTIAVANSDKFYALQVNEIDSTSSKIIAQTPLPELENIAKAIAVKVYAGEYRGSGILIAEKDNTYTVITNAHVTERSDTYTIETSDGIKHNAVISDRQGTENDLAILEFNSNNAYQVAKLGDSKAIAKDETVIAAGFPYDRDNLLITQGKISLLLDKPLAKGYQIGFSNETVQGMSGGLLLNARGEVIGVLGKGKGALLEDSYNYQDGTSPTPESVEQMKDAGFSIPIANIAEISPQLASLLPSTDHPKTAQNSQTETAQKPKYTGIVGKVDKIAEQITVRIDNTQNNTNGSGVIIAKQGSTYYGLTAKHVLCDGISKPHCEPNGTHEIVTPDGKKYKLDYQTVDANRPWLDIAIFAFESDNNYAVATLSTHKPSSSTTTFISGFPHYNVGKAHKFQRFISLGKLVTEAGEDLLVKNIGSLNKDKGNDALVYTNSSYRGMSGGAVLDVEGNLIGINTGSEQELYFDDEGNYSEYIIGFSLGESTLDVLDYIPELTKLSLNITNSSLKKLSNSERKNIVNQFINKESSEKERNLADWMNYAEQLWRYGKHNEAIKAYKKGISNDPNFDKAYYGIGFVYIVNGKWQEASEVLSLATEINPNPYYYWRHLAYCYDLLNQHEKAIFAREQALIKNQDKKNKNSFLYIELADSLKNAKLHYKAFESYIKAIEIDPDNPLLYFSRANFFSQLKQYEQALADLNQALKLDPFNELFYFNRGLQRTRLKQYEQALADFNQVLKLDPQYAGAYYSKGILYSKSNQLEIALANFDRAIKIDPQYADAYIQKGLIHAQFKKPEQALANFNEALKINPQHARAYLGRGLVYGQLTQVEQALADFNRAIEINPQYAEAYENKALLYAYIRNKLEAKKNLEEAARLYKIQNNSRKYQEISQILQAVYK